MLTTASEALMGIRKAKSDQQLSMKAEIASLTINAPDEKLQDMKKFESDLRSVGKIEKISFEVGEVLSISNVSFQPDN
jgi:valyl-tRNA synthetase